MKISPLIISLVIFSGAFYSHCKADTIVIAADSWCPINCDTASKNQGIMVELAHAIFSREGHTVKYLIMPWSRAIEDCRNGKINGIIGAFLGDAPDFIFPKNELLKISGDSFFVKKSSKWRYIDTASLSTITIGAIRDYDYGETMNYYIKNGENVFLTGGANPLERMNKMLLADRIDAIIETPPVFWHTAEKMGLADNFVLAGQASSLEKCYIAFSPKLLKSKEYAEILSKRVLALKRNGEYKAILMKYGMK